MDVTNLLLSRIGWSAVNAPLSLAYVHLLASPEPSKEITADIDGPGFRVIHALVAAGYLAEIDDSVPPLHSLALTLTPDGAEAAAQLPAELREAGRRTVEECMSGWIPILGQMEVNHPGFAAHLLPHLERLVAEAEYDGRTKLGIGMGIYYERAAERAAEQAPVDADALHAMRERTARLAERYARQPAPLDRSDISVVTSVLLGFVQDDLRRGGLPATHRERLDLVVSLQPSNVMALTYLATALIPAVERVPVNLPPEEYQAWRAEQRAAFSPAALRRAEELLIRARTLEMREHGGRVGNLAAITERLGHLWSAKGDYSQARTHFRNARERLSELGDTARLPLLDVAIAQTHLDEGRPDDAMIQMSAALQGAQDATVALPQFAVALSNAAGYLRVLGRPADAASLLRVAADLAARPGVDPSIGALIAENLRLMGEEPHP